MGLQPRRPCSVGSVNRHGIKYQGHYNITLMNTVDSLYLKVYNKSAYANFTNGSLYSPTAEKFGVLPLPSLILESLGMERAPAAFSPILLPSLALLTLNARVSAPLPGLGDDPLLRRSTPLARRRAYHFGNHVASFWQKAKNADEARMLLREHKVALEETEAALDPEVREVELGASKSRDRFTLPPPTGAHRPTPARSSSTTAARRAISRALAEQLARGVKKQRRDRSCKVCKLLAKKQG
ncbi:hypothetical protein BCR35DRAFT_314913 [Leucosporidium creatinivorum]|uniref:Uncharacterized protein n=1 Tax=Leucosporidium creatinivorum TaxID=106004 RepID=A0A1Y2ERG0_9BASI|nr:hypothetical protein BCR35DRAFT_314913 [Leucosporidium creatinivorum]